MFRANKQGWGQMGLAHLMIAMKILKVLPSIAELLLSSSLLSYTKKNTVDTIQ